MLNCEPLAWFGGFVILLCGSFVIIPYWRGKGELISAWSMLLLGVALFAGVGSVEAAVSPIRFSGLDWFNPTKSEVAWFMAAWSIFIATLLLTYYFDPLSRWLSGRIMQKWPPVTTGVSIYVIAVCIAFTATIAVPQLLSITFLGKVLINVWHKSFIFCCVFALVLWFRNPKNLMWLGVFIAVFLVMCVMAMLVANGRRLLLSVFMVPICTFYYYHLRNWRPTRSMALIAIGMIGLFVVNLMYASFRHYSVKKDRTAAGVIDQVRNLGNKRWYQRFSNDRLFALSQQTAHYAMLTDHVVRTGILKPAPLNTFKFIAVYPIPRAIWPDKPYVLGQIIVRQTGLVRNKATNWGCSIPGHAAFEGGLIVAAMFGYMAGFGTRFLDNLLRSQPTNPFLIALFASASMHILAWPRGDASNMSIEVIEAFFFAWALGLGGRIFFGTANTQPATRFVTPRVGPMMRFPAR